MNRTCPGPDARAGQAAPWQFLNFLPLPHGHGALGGVLSHSERVTGVCPAGADSSTGAGAPDAAASARARVESPPCSAEGSLGPEVWTSAMRGSLDPMAAFRDLRGRDPQIEPLLVRRGLTA